MGDEGALVRRQLRRERLEALLVGGGGEGFGGHDDGVFVVIGVVGFAFADFVEAVVAVEGAGGGVGEAAFEGGVGHAEFGGELNEVVDEDASIAVAAVRFGDGDGDDVGFIEHEPEAGESQEAGGEGVLAEARRSGGRGIERVRKVCGIFGYLLSPRLRVSARNVSCAFEDEIAGGGVLGEFAFEGGVGPAAREGGGFEGGDGGHVFEAHFAEEEWVGHDFIVADE